MGVDVGSLKTKTYCSGNEDGQCIYCITFKDLNQDAQGNVVSDQ